jgi:flagellar protein FlaJ
VSEKEDSPGFVQFLSLAPYRLLGNKVNRISFLFKGLEKQLPRADIKVDFKAYVSLTLSFSFISGLSIFAVVFLTSLLVGATLAIALLVASIVGLMSGILFFGILYSYPSMQVGTRRRILEEELPYVASHMAVLSKANMPPERIFRSMTLIQDMGVRSIAAEESKNIIRDVGFLGYDILSAMEERIRNSPSPRFVDFLDGFISVTRSGGDLTNYFLSSARVFMDGARISARRLVETLGGIAETYVSLMVVFPLLVIIMLSIMGIIGGGIGGFSATFLMQLITYLAIPAFALILLLLLDSIMPPR